MSHSQQPFEELAVRGSVGMLVSLLWRRCDNALTVVVSDLVQGDSFAVAVGSANALDVFHHPYAYSPSRA
jgi:hypothetical protein